MKGDTGRKEGKDEKEKETDASYELQCDFSRAQGEPLKALAKQSFVINPEKYFPPTGFSIPLSRHHPFARRLSFFQPRSLVPYA